jgi:hypothetical protein
MTESNLPPNMQEFNEITAVIFGQLYNAFPLPKNIDPDEIAAVLGLSNPRHLMPSGRPFKELLSLTLQWLKAEHFIQSGHPLALGNVTLTTKAMAVMNVVPPSLSRPLGSELADATKQASTEGGKTRISQMMGDFWGSFIGSFTKSITG